MIIRYRPIGNWQSKISNDYRPIGNRQSIGNDYRPIGNWQSAIGNDVHSSAFLLFGARGFL
jgi:hypothetical protein